MQHDIATEQLRHPPRNRQTQSGAAELAAGAGVHLLERVEHALELVRRNADAGIAHRQRDQRSAEQRFGHAGFVAGAPDVKAHGAMGGELECIAEQVIGDLLELAAVGAQGRRQAGVDVQREAQALFRGNMRKRAPQPLRQVGQRQVLDHQFHLAGLDLGQVENVVDQVQQAVAGVVDDARRFDLFVVEVAGVVVGQAARQDQQAVQRRAQLVRHVGQELGLVLACAGQLGSLVGGFLLQVLQHVFLPVQAVGLLAQFLVGRLQFFSLHAQFFFRGNQSFGLFLQFGRLRPQCLVVVAQHFLLLTHHQFGHAQVVGLFLRLQQQAMRVDRAVEVFQGQRHDRQQLVQQLLLQRGERHEAGQFQYADQRVAVEHRQDRDVTRQGLAAAGIDVQVILRHVVEHDGLALDRALAHQPFAGHVVTGRTVAQAQAVAAQQVEALECVVERIEQTDAGLAQGNQLAGQPLREILLGGCLQQHMRNVRYLGSDPCLRLGVQRHLLEYLQRAGDFADLVAAVEPAEIEVEIMPGQPRHQIGEPAQRPGDQLRCQPDHDDAEENAEQYGDRGDGLGGGQCAVQLLVACRQQAILLGNHLIDGGVYFLGANRAVLQIVRLDAPQLLGQGRRIGDLQPGDRVDRIGGYLELPLRRQLLQRIDA